LEKWCLTGGKWVAFGEIVGGKSYIPMSDTSPPTSEDHGPYSRGDGPVPIIRLNDDELKPGMQLEEDIYNRNKVLLLARGAVLNEDTIRIIKRLGYTNVSVQKPPDGPDYWGRIDEQKLTEFKKNYDQSSEEVVELVRGIGEGRQVSMDQAFQVTGSIMQEVSSPYNLFPYLSQVEQLNVHTHGHSINVSLVCRAICHWLGLGDEVSREVVVAGLLHDIGKNRVRPDVLYKTQLTPKEQEEFERHPSLGQRLLEEAGAPEAVRLAALLHHEREDGSGYPRGLDGRQIPLVAKIVAVADVYDTINFDQSRRSKVCPFFVFDRLQQNYLGVLDTGILLTFLARTAESYVGEIVHLSDGRTGQIVVINRASPSRPMVRTKEGIIDLSVRPEISIEAVLPVGPKN